MVIAVCSFALALVDGSVGRASARPRRRRCGRARPRRSRPALDRGALSEVRRALRRTGRRGGVADRRRRGTAAYRPHALSVLARRTLTWAWEEHGHAADAARSTASRARSTALWEGESLLYVLRERLALPGSKNACEQGECGSCSVYLDGALVCSCLVAAGQAEGRVVVTVEGLGRRGRAAPGPGGVPRGRRGAVRVLHAGADRRDARPARAQPVAVATRRSARRWPATCAAARATRRSSTRCGWRRQARMRSSRAAQSRPSRGRRPQGRHIVVEATGSSAVGPGPRAGGQASGSTRPAAWRRPG